MQCEHNLSTASVNRFVTTCLQTCNNLCVLTCVRSKRFQFCIEVHFMTPYNKNRYLYYFFSLTSLLSRVYCQQVFLDKFTFSCVLSTSFLWQVYFFVCTVNKFSLTSFATGIHGNECRQTYHISRQGRFLFAKPGREITAGKRTMSGQNAELSGQSNSYLAGHFDRHFR